jgi:hypothetical protein
LFTYFFKCFICMFVCICRKGSKHLQARISGTQELVTVVVAANANGDTIPPYLIFKGKTQRCLQSVDCEEAPAGTKFAYSESGWTKTVSYSIRSTYAYMQLQSG